MTDYYNPMPAILNYHTLTEHDGSFLDGISCLTQGGLFTGHRREYASDGLVRSSSNSLGNTHANRYLSDTRPSFSSASTIPSERSLRKAFKKALTVVEELRELRKKEDLDFSIKMRKEPNGNILIETNIAGPVVQIPERHVINKVNSYESHLYITVEPGRKNISVFTACQSLDGVLHAVRERFEHRPPPLVFEAEIFKEELTFGSTFNLFSNKKVIDKAVEKAVKVVGEQARTQPRIDARNLLKVR